MTTEELKVRVSLDTSGLKSDINKAKQSLSDLNKQTDKAMSGTSSSTAGTNNQLSGMQDTLKAILALNFGEAFLSVMQTDKIKNATKQIRTSFDATKKDVKESIGNIANGIEALWPGKSKNMEFTGKGWKNAMAHFKESGASTALKNMASGLKAVGVAAAAALAPLLIVAEALALILGTINAINRAKINAQDAFNAEKIGMTAQAYGEWGYVITQLGGEVDELTDYIRTLSAAQNEVRAGSEDVIASFARLGMSAEEIDKMSQGEMFTRTIAGLQNIENEVERVSLAYKIFGEDDGAKVTTLLNTNNAEIERMIHNYHMLGGVMSGELINNSKVLSGSLGNLRVAWIGLRNTLAEVFLPIIIPVVQWLTRAVAVVNMFIRAIFGKDIVAASTDIGNVASAYTGYTDSANNATQATNGVTEAIERLKRVTMGFDELNKLPGTDSSSSTSGNDSGVSQLPTGGSTGGLSLPSTEDLGLDGIAEWIDKNKQKIQDITAVLLTLAGVAIAVFYFLHGNIVGGIAGLALAGLGIAIGAQDGGIWDRLVEGIKGVWEKVKTWFTSTVAPVFTKDWWVKKWNSIKDGAAEMWNKFKDSAFIQWFAGLKDKAVSLTATFKEKGAEIRANIKAAWDNVKTKAATLTATFKQKGADVRKAVVNAYGKIVTKTRTLTAKFKSSGAYKTIASYWDKFKTKSSTLSVKFKDSFTAAIKKAWNGLVKAINKAIGTINKIPGVNISKLPYLATGGIVTSPTTAVIGEAGREAVLPLDRNTGWMDALADKIAARGGGSGGPTKIILTVDGKQLGWATIDNINSITRQTGSLPLKLV